MEPQNNHKIKEHSRINKTKNSIKKKKCVCYFFSQDLVIFVSARGPATRGSMYSAVGSCSFNCLLAIHMQGGRLLQITCGVKNHVQWRCMKKDGTLHLVTRTKGEDLRWPWKTEMTFFNCIDDSRLPAGESAPIREGGREKGKEEAVVTWWTNTLYYENAFIC